jgi:transposase
MVYGLDVHKKFIAVCALDDQGEKRGEFRVGGSASEIEAFACKLERSDRIVLEATFDTWAVSRILSRYVDRVVVANPLEVKAIAHARIKTDKVDAHTLAKLLYAGFVPEVELPDEATWQKRQLVSHRQLLMRQQRAAKNAIHAVLLRGLIEAQEVSVFSKAGRAWLRQLELGSTERFLLDNGLLLLEAIEARVAEADERLRAIAAEEAPVKLLMTIPGVHITVAIGLLSAIGDVQRFHSPGQLASYLGLVPRVRQSADHCHHGRITKAGSSTARSLAIEAAQSLARSPSPIAATYHRVRRKRGHNVAVTALARKLIVVVWHLLTKHEAYRYAPVERTRVKLASLRPKPRPRSASPPRTLDGVLAEAGLPALAAAAPAERRAAAANRRTSTRLRAANSRTLGA